MRARGGNTGAPPVGRAGTLSYAFVIVVAAAAAARLCGFGGDSDRLLTNKSAKVQINRYLSWGAANGRGANHVDHPAQVGVNKRNRQTHAGAKVVISHTMALN